MRVQEKETFMVVRCELKIPSLGIRDTRNCSASLGKSCDSEQLRNFRSTPYKR